MLNTIIKIGKFVKYLLQKSPQTVFLVKDSIIIVDDNKKVLNDRILLENLINGIPLKGKIKIN